MLSKYSYEKKSIMQTLKPPRYLPVMPITIPLEYPLENRYRVTGIQQQTPQGKLRGYCRGAQPHPQVYSAVYSPYSSIGHHPGHLLQVSVRWQDLPCLDCTQILQQNDRKCSLVIPYTLVRKP